MKPSEIFEGENSSLKKTFDEAVKKHTHQSSAEVLDCYDCKKDALEKSIKDQQELMDKHTPDIVETVKLSEKTYTLNGFSHLFPEQEKTILRILEEAHQQGFKDGEQKGREDTISEIDDVPRCLVTHKDGSQSIHILQHSLETHSLTKKTVQEYKQALKDK